MVNLQKNFTDIIGALQTKQMKLTQIAKAIGFTTTTQLHSVIEGDSLLSTKAAIALIENLNVNPTYLFLGKGEIFLTDESEIEDLQKKCSDWQQKYFSVQDELLKCKEQLENAVHRYNKLIDITSIALDKTKSEKKDKLEE